MFNKNELNQWNVGEKFMMEVEIIEIEKMDNIILYSVKPTYPNSLKIYGITNKIIEGMSEVK